MKWLYQVTGGEKGRTDLARLERATEALESVAKVWFDDHNDSQRVLVESGGPQMVFVKTNGVGGLVFKDLCLIKYLSIRQGEYQFTLANDESFIFTFKNVDVSKSLTTIVQRP